MKRIIYISLLFVCLLQCGGLQLIYQFQQYLVQQQMQRVVANKATRFQKLTLSLSDYKKAKINSHEISVNGKMYDVKSISMSGDKVELLAINDSKEDDIIAAIGKSVGGNEKQNKELPSRLARLLTSDYIFPSPIHIFLPEKNKQNNFYSLRENIISSIIEISSPPPRIG